MNVIDKEIVQKRFSKNFESYKCMAIVQRQIASRLAYLLQKTGEQNYNRILEIGCGTGFLTEQMIKNFSISEYFLNDIVDSSYQKILLHTQELEFHNFKFISGDAECVTFPNQLDAIISTSTFQWFHNLEGFFLKASNLLNSNGLFAFSTFGKNNFKEIKSTLDVGLAYKNLQNITDLLSSDFEIIHSEEWVQEEQFKNPKEVLQHMKFTGVNGVSAQKFTRGSLQQFEKEYRTRYSGIGGCVHLSYNPIIVVAKKK